MALRCFKAGSASGARWKRTQSEPWIFLAASTGAVFVAGLTHRVLTAHSGSADRCFGINNKWCPRPDLNRHGLRHYPLKIACLPIPPLGLCTYIIRPAVLTARPAGCRRCSQTRGYPDRPLELARVPRPLTREIIPRRSPSYFLRLAPS